MNIFEFRILNPSTGLADIVLPDVETFTLSPALSDVGTVQFTYPHNGVNYSQILNDRDLCVYYNGAEVLSLRSTLEQSQGDDATVAEEGSLKNFNGRMSFSHFDRAIVYPSGWPASSDPATQAYSGVAIGAVLIDLIQKAQVRSGLPGISWSFTATHDSNGVAWSNVTISFNAQTTYLTCFQTMVAYALCDLQMVGYRLDAYVYQTQGVDHTTAEPPTTLRKGRDLTQAQDQNSTMGLSTVALVAGSNNTYVEVTNSPGQSVRGRREIGLSQSGVQDEGTLAAVGAALLQTVADEVKSRTLQLNFADPSCPLPLTGFNLGDWVYVDLNDGVLRRQRILLWSVSVVNDGTMSGTVTLDNIFQERINRLNGRLNALQNGVILTGTSDPTPVETIKYPPAVPTGLAIGTSTYQDDQGHTFAQASVSWNAVTLDSNGGPETNLSNYALRHRLSPAGSWSAITLVDSGVTVAYASPFTPTQAYDFEVSAIDNQNNTSGWSAPVTVTMVADTVAPNQPSTPTVTSRLGQLSVVWDGKDSSAASMPVDFDHVNVYVSAAGSGFTPAAANLYGTMRVGQSLQVSGNLLAYNTTYWVKLIAADHTGNLSGASSAGSATLVQIVNTDLGSGQVGLSNVSFSDVGNLIDNGSFEDPTWQAIRNAEFGGTHWTVDGTTSSSGTTSVRHTGAVGSDETVVLNTVNAKPGQTFMGAVDIKMDSGVTSSTMRVALGIIWRNSAGTSLGYVDLAYNWNSPSTNDNTWRARITGVGQVAPAATVKADFVLSTTSHTAGNVWFDNVEVRMQLDTLLVADAAITDAKIASLTANKITAGTINAGIILAGTIQTAASGARILLDGPSDTIYIYDSSSVNIGTWGPTGFALYTSPGTASLKVTPNPGTTFSPILEFVANSVHPPSTGARIYTNTFSVPLGGGSFGYYEDLILKSPINPDGSFTRITLLSGISGAASQAQGNILMYDPAGGSERAIANWSNDLGLTVATKDSNGNWSQLSQPMLGPSYMDINIQTATFTAGVATFNPGVGFTLNVGNLDTVFCFSWFNDSAVQFQVNTDYNNGSVTVSAWDKSGTAVTGSHTFWVMCLGH